MWRKIGILLFASLAVLFSVAGAAQATGIVNGIYINDEYGFQISLPDDLKEWDMTDKKKDVGLVVIDGPLFETLAVSATPLDLEEAAEEPDQAGDQVTFLDVWVEITLALYPFIFDNWKEESKREMKIGGVDAYEIVATGAMEGLEMRIVTYMFVNGDFGYLILGISLGDPFPSPLDEFRSIVSTFRFVPEPEEKSIGVSPQGRLITTWGRCKIR